jgi:hypothetical protein
MRKLRTLSVLAVAALSSTAVSIAAPITPGDLVVYRVGDTSTALSNTGNAVFIDEFKTDGTPVQSIAMPIAASGSNNPFVASGTATSEGLLNVSPDGKFVVVTGYDRAPGGTGSVAGTTSAAVPRVVGLINVATGAVDTSTALTDYASANNPRSATTTDGTNIWAVGAAGGVLFTTHGATTSTQISSNQANNRQVNIFGDQLYATSSSGTNTNKGVNTIGGGVPTSGSNAESRLTGLADSTNPSDYAFFFADLDAATPGLDTLYIADDDGTAGGILKFSLVSGNWTKVGTAGSAADGYRGLTGFTDASGVHLFATRKGGSAAAGGGELVSLTDTSGFNASFSSTTPTLLASAITGAAANTAFRGVGIIAVPEPASVACVALIGFLAHRRRRERIL